jgi:hypothetical protein
MKKFLNSFFMLAILTLAVGMVCSDAEGALAAALTSPEALLAIPVLGITVGSELQLNVLLDAALRGLRKTLLPVIAFSTVFRDVMLKGTDKVAVPYYPIESAVSKDFTGTYEFDDGDVQSREVTVDNRKYQSLSFTSAELARQPHIKLEEIGMAKGAKLGEDVLTDILSLATLANFGAHIFAGAASSFDTEAVADIRTALNQANWPKSGRALILDTAYDGNLVKDEPLLHADKAGTNRVLMSGDVVPFMGFDRYFDTNMIPANGETLVGMAVFSSAILTAFSPIEPAPDVRANMTEYQTVTDPETQLTLEYRAWGDPDHDTSKRVIECNYGFALGEANALKRIVTTAP